MRNFLATLFIFRLYGGLNQIILSDLDLVCLPGCARLYWM